MLKRVMQSVGNCYFEGLHSFGNFTRRCGSWVQMKSSVFVQMVMHLSIYTLMELSDTDPFVVKL